MSPALGLVLVAGLVALVGRVMIWVALWRLGDEWMEGTVKAGVVLEALALIPFLGFLGLISAILYLVELRSIEKRIECYILETLR